MGPKIRDAVETLPEMEDVNLELPLAPAENQDELVDEALQESFPASDPPASGRME
jgi:metal-sulfur cluster biosynthetic enzyme